jgi:SAM-dependent methyltransferase
MAFSAEWLAQREPADRAARSRGLVAHLVAHLPASRPLTVVDLGCGTGANLRALADDLPSPQAWLLVDRDAHLLEACRSLIGVWANTPGHESRRGHRVDTRTRDLREIPHDEILRAPSLVTASALLDLVSRDWLAATVDACARARAAVLFALSYDGRILCVPADPVDRLVRELVNEHQHGDKGFGPALGPEAGDTAARLLRARGYTVETADSDWHLGPDAHALQTALISGWAEAATEIAPDRTADIRAWASRRHTFVAEGRSAITVGHVDLAAWRDGRDPKL